MRRKGGRRHSFLQHELFSQQHNSKVQGQGDGTCDDVLLLPMLSTVIVNEPGQVMEEMEKLHGVWMQDQQGALGLIPGQETRSYLLQLKKMMPHVTLKIKDPTCHN